MVSRRFKAGCLITLLVLVCVAFGFFLGVGFSKAMQRKKNDPTWWNEAALKHLEKLHPTDAQRARFTRVVGGAVDELIDVRNRTVGDVRRIIVAVVDDLEKELTPEQKEQFQKMKPKTEDLDLEVLKKTGKGGGASP